MIAMSEKACSNCHFLTRENVCPKCRSTSLSEDFGGLIIVFDVEGSAIGKAMKITSKGRYALKVR